MKNVKKFDFLGFMVKADRFSAWVLFIVVLSYAITGYGMTKGVINRDLATSLHLKWLGIIGLAAFIIHTGWAIRLAFKRWKMWNLSSKVFLALFFILIVLFFFYLHFFYGLEANKNVSRNKSIDDNNISETIFTAETLSEYNGLNGKPAYIAIDGLVYDVSSLFKNGEHRGCYAGKDVSKEFYKVHLKKMLEGFEVVGKYQAD